MLSVAVMDKVQCWDS